MSLKVNLKIAGRTYPLVVQDDEEEILRNATKRIQKYVSTFDKDYNINDKQDSLAMSALQLASELENLLKNIDREHKEILLKVKNIKALITDS
ncbi:cell division protein ZapA [Apibacter muscae]|uniref:Cell division protein ZapA n=1 Tax=Apibacter muscae TaxID=2509004 RepID=A0A563DJ28_9FLAO|nr:cell division protein ZapA [Apibacter muscae]TWP24760.1 cell division protein ZapA [Apibacter muscae]TWP29814.1 cell division protein ZapA [Apibacter muscae]TWP30962.1 cell division protein ZapA [Apibacter muscae]